MKKILTAIITICFAIAGNGQVVDSPKREIRAVWLTTLMNLDWPRTRANDECSMERQKQELCDLLDMYQQANINTVLLQAVVRATAIYPSDILPWDACMTGRFNGNPGYDPLAFAISECHKRGMEIQAWIVTMPVGRSQSPAVARLKRKGYKMMQFDGNSYLDPSDSRTVRLITSVAREITTRYDIDGIHLDYIRYPEMMRPPKNSRIAQWRRDKITAIVRSLHDTVKAIKPWVKISCSPIGKYSDLTRYSSHNWNARDRVSQDAQLWVRRGLMDQLYPMIYFRGDNYYPFAADWAENRYGKAVAAGLGTYFLNQKEGGKRGWTLFDIVREMMVARQMGLGTAHFRSRFFTDNEKGIYDFSSLVYAPYPALVPEIDTSATAGKDYKRPERPRSIKIDDGTMRIDGSSTYYNVYCSDSWPVDVSKACNLLLARNEGKTVKINAGTSWQPQFYAVTAIDRYGKESEPLQSWNGFGNVQGQLECANGLVCVNNLPDSSAEQACLEVRTIQGSTVRSIPINSMLNAAKIDVTGLDYGTYSIYYVARYNRKKKYTRRLGFFLWAECTKEREEEQNVNISCKKNCLVKMQK